MPTITTSTSESRANGIEKRIDCQSLFSITKRTNCDVSDSSGGNFTRLDENHCQLLSNWHVNEDYKSRETLLRLPLKNGIYERSLPQHTEFYVGSFRTWDDDKVKTVVGDAILANLKPGAVLGFFHNCGCKNAENCPLKGTTVTKLQTMLINRYGTIKNESEDAKNYDHLTNSESLVRFWLNVSRFVIIDNTNEENNTVFLDETDHIDCDESESTMQFGMAFRAGEGVYYPESNTLDNYGAFKVDTVCFSEDERRIFSIEVAKLLEEMFLDQRVQYAWCQWFREYIDSDDFVEKVSEALYAHLNGADWRSIFEILGFPEYNHNNLMMCRRALLLFNNNATENENPPEESYALRLLRAKCCSSEDTELKRVFKLLNIRVMMNGLIMQ